MSNGRIKNHATFNIDAAAAMISLGGDIADAFMPKMTITLRGDLGAGKTTLISHIISHAKGKRLELIVNEFGDAGMDADMLGECQ